MANQAHFDLAAFSGVKPSLDASLGEVSARMEQFLAAPALNTASLEAARSEIKR